MKANILVVDDSPTVGHIVTAALSDLGYTVRRAEDGIRAMSVLHSFRADLILLDIRLPYLDGLKLLQILRHGLAHKETPIVMISAMSSSEDIKRAIDSGADACLTKPFTDSQLLDVVERQLNRQSLRLAS